MIYLIRHGEAAASWGSHPDPGLSEQGRVQAQSVAQDLQNQGIASIISSPMERCQETAEAFSEVSGLAKRIEPNVSEIPTPEDTSDRVAWLRGLMSGEWSDAPAIVEHWRQSLIDTVSTLPDHTVVFTHFVAINALVGHFEDTQKVTVFRPNYCSVTKLSRDDEGLKLVSRGDELETRVL